MARGNFNARIEYLNANALNKSHKASKAHFELWQAGQGYQLLDSVRTEGAPSFGVFVCVQAGTSGAAAPYATGAGDVVTDGTCKWQLRQIGMNVAQETGPSMSAVMSQKAVTDALGAIVGISLSKSAAFDALPAAGSPGVIYLVGAASPYDEYIWVDGQYEMIGSTAVDLTGYATLAELEEALSNIELTPGPPGTSATIAIGTVTTGEAGTEAGVVNAGTANAAILNITIPCGADGIAPSITVGTVATLPAGDMATVEVDESSTENSVILNCGIPGGSGSGDAGGGYHQASALAAPAGTAVTLSVNNPQDTYNFRPPMVLKFVPGETGASVAAFGFSEGDAEDWLINGLPAIQDGQAAFDGTMRLRTEYEYPFGEPQALGEGFLFELELDFAKFKSVESIA